MAEAPAGRPAPADDALCSVARRLTAAAIGAEGGGYVGMAELLRELAADVEAEISRRGTTRLHITVGAGRPQVDPALVTVVDGHTKRRSAICVWPQELPAVDAYPGQVVTDQHRGDGAIVRTWWERLEARSGG